MEARGHMTWLPDTEKDSIALFAPHLERRISLTDFLKNKKIS